MSPITATLLVLWIVAMVWIPVWALLYARGEDDTRQREAQA